jgi:hypothetical protein
LHGLSHLAPRRCGARAGEPGRCREIAAQHRHTGRQTGPHRVRPGSGAGRQEPGASSGARAQRLYRAAAAESGDKLTRFGPFSSQCRVGNVKILRGLWNEDLFRVLEGFLDLAYDDEVDACSGALEMLNPDMKGWVFFEAARRRAEQLQAEREVASGRPEPTYAPGSMEWLAEQEKLKGGGFRG